ncbi:MULTISPECIES: DegT/DnrJ/EryC1/StrS family aminotransferase [unclassified Streptomyces]|uniref:DegT/DnrJ/EryC1/StrS family aminotransferase n=1 Tax=unclassified Streptomyces TaxID=2593676 RepID=UPI002DDBC196|nr:MULTISPECIES: DegT/DnrJ/EryC1/StrS family aminotransferase [unclassified Streptomyces]WSA92020.1 DegT/DnrJ/EryC1/StrS family aminotransferase [Streptomyces sp. NBC_01795]WSB76387.1 DegT/DnrJ/EryC1/StrS family aminotransferase [Streptomyces sp. NBC_01775]WSS15338.1 DegT/DnrJ/EryC1/StrS family aminotransferase [Streptomyces sp. NBC_01186]WSS44183.1 DegT/DnrJ/EryC1/StrS family aminotransferase [Streptomyces sp. NBC_01187]
MGTTQLTAAGIGAGNDVVVPSFGGAEVAQAVRQLGARPVFADIDAHTYCLDPDAAEAAITPETVAFVPVHLFGHPADMTALQRLGARTGIRVIAWEPLPRADAVDAVRRRQHAAYLGRRLSGVVAPEVEREAEHAFTRYVVRVPGNGRPDRDAFRRALRMRGIECEVPVRAPAHRTPEFRTAVRLPEAERAADECLALPLAASMSKKELQQVISACNGLGGLLQERAS